MLTGEAMRGSIPALAGLLMAMVIIGMATSSVGGGAGSGAGPDGDGDDDAVLRRISICPLTSHHPSTKNHLSSAVTGV